MLWIIGNQLSEINRRGSPAGSAQERVVAGGGSEAGCTCRVLKGMCSAVHHTAWWLSTIIMLFTQCPKGARCNKCNILETSRGIHWRVKCWGSGGREREGEGKRNKPEATKMT